MGAEGFISSMNRSIEQNRAMAKRKDGYFKKGVNARYDKKGAGQNEESDQFIDPVVQERIRVKLLKQRGKSIRTKVTVIGLSVVLAGLLIFIGLNFTFEGYSSDQLAELKSFETLTSKTEDGLDVKVEFYESGTQSARTLYKNGVKHEQSISYYESGEKFRSATYLHGSLVSETYFFKTGEQIADFPLITDDKIHHIELLDPNRSVDIEFDFYDGKILGKTYSENYHAQL